jgi:hypothetical protein
MLPDVPIVNQYDHLIFGRKVKRANREYERNFNNKVDLGV